MKTTKHLLTLALIFFCLNGFAQGGRFKQKMEQVKSLKVAFITNELQLTADESAKFWPLYNAFEDKQREIRKQKVSAYLGRRENDNAGNMSEKEASALLAQMEDNEEQLYQLRKKFVSSLKGVLPAVKIIKLKKAEEDFNKKLLEQYRERRGK
ncbi:MAG: sensor of ECF-type sigma factor [Flavobacterium sp.]|nr:MAG: sensor of ECF-type sigma factor [Flavobacterium sp.]